MTHNKLARAKMDQVVNDWPEACWLCVKYNLVIDGSVASGCTIPVMTMSGSKTLSQRRYSGEPVFRKIHALGFLGSSLAVTQSWRGDTVTRRLDRPSCPARGLRHPPDMSTESGPRTECRQIRRFQRPLVSRPDELL